MLAKLRIIGTVALVATSFFAGTEAAQTAKDSISLGDVQLVIGMPEAGVLSKLGDQFQLAKRGSPGAPTTTWQVRSREGGSVGSVAFKNGKLWLARKYWVDVLDDPGAAKVVQAVLDVVTEFEKQGNTACTITTSREHEPDFHLEEALVTCGRRKISVALYKDDPQYPQGISASVDETLLPR
jgi:hypothetical protein